MIRRLIAAAAFALSGAALAAPLTSVETTQIDRAATEILARTGVPAASVAVVKDGAVVYAHAYGKQRLAPDRMAIPEARYAIASVSKQFTAAAVLMLADAHKLSLDDPVGKYLPGLSEADKVTLRQLLSHTSGYRDFWPQDYSFADMARPVEPQTILDRWAKLPLDFAPGAKWQYSNTGFVAAGLVVEKVSGQPLMTFLGQHIFTPLGMKAVDADYGMTAADAGGYMRFALGPVRAVTPAAPGWLFAAGQLAMSASDLARWDISVIDRTLMSPAAYAAQQTEVKLTDGSGSGYGLGVDVAKVGDHRVIKHGGEAVGYLSENRIYPDDRAAVVVLVNADFGNAHTAIADRIERLLLPDTEETQVARTLYAQLKAGTLDRSLLTANGNYYFTPTALADYRSTLQRLGEPTTFVRDSAKLRGGLTAEVYTLTYPAQKLRLVLRAVPGGKVEQFMLMPVN